MTHIDQFLSSAIVVDTETTGLDPATAEIVEFATARFENKTWFAWAQLFNARKGIPPEASAKNQISSRMIQHQQYFGDDLGLILDMLGNPKYFVAHNADYDRQILETSLAQIGQRELAQMFEDQRSWICTWRLSKKIYQHEFSDQLYGQNYLRYKLDLPIPDEVGVHRAGADVQVCGLLLERLIVDGIRLKFVNPNQDIGPQLVSLSWDPIPVLKWPSGKFRDVSLDQIPTDYYLWALENYNPLKEGTPAFDSDLAVSVGQELEKRLTQS